MLTHLLFDFFGTLVTYTPGHFHDHAYEQTYHLLETRGFSVAYDHFVEQFSAAFGELERGHAEALHEFHMHDVGKLFFRNTFDQDIDTPFLATFIATYISEWSRGVTYLPGIEQIIDQAGQTFTLGIISNTHYPQLIHQHLAAMKIARYFDVVVTSVEHGHRKPHPKIFQDTLAQLQISAAQAIYIGDNYTDDYVGATANGIRCILIDPKQRYATTVPDRVDVLADIFQAIGGRNTG